MNLKRPFPLLALLICVVFGVAFGQEQAYLLGPGDVLEIRVFGQHDLNSTAQIDGDGNLSSLPFLDPIPAKCRTERAAGKVAGLRRRFCSKRSSGCRMRRRLNRRLRLPVRNSYTVFSNLSTTLNSLVGSATILCGA